MIFSEQEHDKYETFSESDIALTARCEKSDVDKVPTARDELVLRRTLKEWPHTETSGISRRRVIVLLAMAKVT